LPKKKRIFTGFTIVIFSLFFATFCVANENEEVEKAKHMAYTLKERLVLIKASRELVKKQMSLPKIRFASYAIGLDPEYGEVNWGIRFEWSPFSPELRVLLEGVSLEREKPAVAFLSLMWLPLYRSISPYIGLGIGTASEEENTRYQLFAGAEIGSDFFVEIKYVNEDRINPAGADIYAAAGFHIPL